MSSKSRKTCAPPAPARVQRGKAHFVLGKAVALAPWLSRGEASAALDSAAFLIDAVAREPVRVAATKRESMSAQFVYVLDMFERLERAERFGE